MKTNVIKLQFLRYGKPAGREYTYLTNTDVAVGDIIEIDGKQGISQGIVTKIDVPEAEIAPFRDRAKAILGKAVQKADEKRVNQKKVPPRAESPLSK